MKSIKTRIQDLENSLSPKEPTLLELMDMASGVIPGYIPYPLQTKEELEIQAKEPGLLGRIAEADLRTMRYKVKEEKGN